MEAKDGRITQEIINSLSSSIASKIQDQLQSNTQRTGLRLSQMGERCPKSLWHSIHTPERREALPPWAEIKYTYGYILESLLLCLAKAAGHDVKGEQDEVTLDGITGHRDCIIDGCLVDVKSASSLSFQKFKDGSIAENDTFGYLDQLDGYLVGSLEDPLVNVKDRAYNWVIDKQLGKMHLYEHIVRKDRILKRISEAKTIVARTEPPKCDCRTEPFGRSGNIKLGVRASYDAFKWCCFPKLRCFLYANGPVYLTHVEKVPDVPEVDKYGNIFVN